MKQIIVKFIDIFIIIMLIFILSTLTSCSYGSYQHQYNKATTNLREAFPDALIWEDEYNHMYFILYDPVTNKCYKANLGNNRIGLANLQILLPLDSLNKELNH
jgi:hypothetical protein